jgi:protoheme IX farnesyltransferase
MAFYVLVYTMWLKRRSAQNIVIGGAAGAVPALVGWAAVTGRVGWPAVVLFDIVFLWTPPHFWALALRYRRDYAAAGVPMLPVVSGEAETTRQILMYSAVLVATTLVLVPVAHLGWFYGVAAVALGARFLLNAARLYAKRTPASAMALFRYSLVYLAAVFAAVAIDTLIRFGL